MTMSDVMGRAWTDGPRDAGACRPTGCRGAFTLIEMLVVTSIVALVIGVVGACLGAGIRVWETARRCNELESQSLLALAILEKDLMNSLAFHEIPFKAGGSQLSFAGTITESARGGRIGGGVGDEPVERLATIRYSLDATERKLVRKQWLFPGSEFDTRDTEAVLSNVRAARFRFLSLPAGSEPGKGGRRGDGQWCDEWNNATNLPSAVRVELSMGDDRQPLEIVRTLVRPCQP
jgi:prepilin-type N-terminal cleavage/methylation domain-containing protein